MADHRYSRNTLYSRGNLGTHFHSLSPCGGKKGGGGAGKFSLFFFVLFFNTFAKKEGRGGKKQKLKMMYGEKKKDVREKSSGAAITEIAFCRVHTGWSAREIWVCTRGWYTALYDGRNESGVFTLLLEVKRTDALSFCRLGVATIWSNPMATIKLKESPD